MLQKALQRQRGYQQQAELAVLERIKDYTSEQRQARQQEMAQQFEDDLMDRVRQAQPHQEAASTVQGQASQDYMHARQSALTRQREAAQTLAKLLGKTVSAGPLRQQEHLQLTDTGQTLDCLGQDAHGMAQADQFAIQEAGTPHGWQQLAGELLKGAGTVGLARGLGRASTRTVSK